MSTTVSPLLLDPQSRFLSEADCLTLTQQLRQAAVGGGSTEVHIISRWRGNIRWARNRIISGGDDQDSRITIWRTVQGARSRPVTIDDVSSAALVAAVRRAEQLAQLAQDYPESDAGSQPQSPFVYHDEPVTQPSLFFASTYQLDPEQRAGAAERLMRAAREAGMLSAGYIEVSATSLAFLTSWGYKRYFQYTWARYKTTVRDPQGISSGWAGVDWPDWSKIDGEQLSTIALEKCLKSRNPVAIEPGRYTTILEPQAVCDLLAPWGGCTDGRERVEQEAQDSWHQRGTEEPTFQLSDDLQKLGLAKFGEQVIDHRLTIQTDPLDPAVAFAPYQMEQYGVSGSEVYQPVIWIERGVLKNLGEGRDYAIKRLGRETTKLAPGSFRMSVDGPTASIAEMIQSTKRGLLVTRCDQVLRGDGYERLTRGYTRDGLWLIENGTISKPVKNMMFSVDELFVLNNVDQVGVPQRCYHPGARDYPELGGILDWYFNPQPVIAPALKIRDFSFVALSNAI